MTAVSDPARQLLIFDSPCLSHFARADRLDVLRDLLTDSDCWTTHIVIEELRIGAAQHPAIRQALEQEWIRVQQFDSLNEIRCFAAWVRRIGTGERDIGEASVLAAAELRPGIAITDDREAVRVGRVNGVQVHGTIWLLAAACRSGKLSLFGASNLIDSLRANSHRLPCTGAEFQQFASQHGLL